MGKSQMSMDTQMPDLSKAGDVDQKFAMVSDYLFQLAEHQRYLFSNLDGRNFNKKGLTDIADWITQPIHGKISDVEGDVAELTLTSKELSAKLSDVEGNVAGLRLTAQELSAKLSDVEGNVSGLSLTAKTLSAKVSDIEGNVSTLQLTSQSISSSVSDLKGSVSKITQKVDSITLSVTNGETSSTIQMKAGDTLISSQTIRMKGLVTFEALKGEGKTQINGSNITTGTLSAESVKLKGKFRVYSGETMGGYIGYMAGSTGDTSTNGIGVCNVNSDCYVIATDAGVAISAGSNVFHITKIGSGRLNCKLEINGELVVDGIVKAREFIKT